MLFKGDLRRKHIAEGFAYYFYLIILPKTVENRVFICYNCLSNAEKDKSIIYERNK